MKNEKWMTVNEAVQLFREKKSDFTEQNFAHLAIKYNFPKKYPRVGWGKSDADFQAYSAEAVLECFKTYKPKNRFTYTVDTPPPAGWLTLRNIADYLGANFARVQKMCSTLTVPARFYKGKRYAPLALFEELLPWRPSFFVRKHRSDEWILKRIAWQEEKKTRETFQREILLERAHLRTRIDSLMTATVEKTWVTRAELIAEANSIRVPLGLKPFSATSSGSLWSTFERKRNPKSPHRFLYHREYALARLLAYRPTSQPVNRPATESELRSGKLVLVTDACSALGLSPNVVYSAVDKLSFPGYRHPVTNRLLVDVQDFLRCAFFRQKSFIDRHFSPSRARIIFASRPWIRVGAGAFEKKLYFVPELVRAGSRAHPLPQHPQKTSTQK